MSAASRTHSFEDWTDPVGLRLASFDSGAAGTKTGAAGLAVEWTVVVVVVVVVAAVVVAMERERRHLASHPGISFLRRA